MRYLVDTNILLRLAQKSHPMHGDVRRGLVALRTQGIVLCIVPQNLIEFWAVATRTLANNGLGLSTDKAAKEIKKLKRIFILCPDTQAIFDLWENLVVKYQGHRKINSRYALSRCCYRSSTHTPANL